jgi:hypothetical protein
VVEKYSFPNQVPSMGSSSRVERRFPQSCVLVCTCARHDRISIHTGEWEHGLNSHILTGLFRGGVKKKALKKKRHNNHKMLILSQAKVRKNDAIRRI